MLRNQRGPRGQAHRSPCLSLGCWGGAPRATRLAPGGLGGISGTHERGRAR